MKNGLFKKILIFTLGLLSVTALSGCDYISMVKDIIADDPDVSEVLSMIDSTLEDTTTTEEETTTTKKSTTSYTGELEYNTGAVEDLSTNAHICDDGFVEDIVYENFQIHFMETGAYNTGDATYIKAGDTDILIDAGSSTSSAATLEKYIDQYCTDGVLEYVIVTHSHSDHWSGMFGSSSNPGIMYYYKIGTIIEFAQTTKTNTATTTEYGKYLAALDNAVNNGATLYTAAQCFNNEDGAKDTYVLDESLGITMKILYNYYYFNKSSDENNHSVCTLFTYGNYNYMMTGDLEIEGEQKMAEYYDGSTLEKTLPEVTLFKAGHHGSSTSSNECLLSIIKPQICVCCCCSGSSEYTVDADAIFPTQAFITRIGKYTDRVYVTSTLDEKATYEQSSYVFGSLNGSVIISSNSAYVGLYATNNLIKLKDSDWFNETIYVDSNNAVASGKKGSKLFYKYYSSDYTKDGLTARVRRVWPSE